MSAAAAAKDPPEPVQAPEKKAARVVVPMRLSPQGKAAIQRVAAEQGYDQYTAWMRDVLAQAVTDHDRKNNRR